MKSKLTDKVKHNTVSRAIYFLFIDKNFFIAIIALIIGILSLLQLPEVRCLAQLPQENCISEFIIILKIIKIFCFLGFFGIFLLGFIFMFGIIIPIVLPFVFRIIKYNLYNLRFRYSQKNNIYNLTIKRFYKLQYKITKSNIFLIFVADPINQYKYIFKAYYYLFVMFLTFIISYRIAKNATLSLNIILDTLLKKLIS